MRAYFQLIGVSFRQETNRFRRDPTGALKVLCVLLLVIVATISGRSSYQVSEELQHELSHFTPTSPLTDKAYTLLISHLDFYFWLILFVSASFGFYVVEIYYRSKASRIYAQLPFSPQARFLERTSAGAIILLFPFFALIPYSFVDPIRPILPIAKLLMIGTSLIAVLLCCAGLNAYIGVNFASPNNGGRATDAYGGPGGALLYAPFVGFGSSVIAIFLIKLGTQELVRAAHPTNAFFFAYALAIFLSVICYLSGLRAYCRDGDRLNAWFHEYDSVGFQSIVDYQKSVWPESITPFQKFLVALLVPRHRRHRYSQATFKRLLLEHARCYPFDRAFRVLGSLTLIACALYLPDYYKLHAMFAVVWFYYLLVEPVALRISKLDSECQWILKSLAPTQELRDSLRPFTLQALYRPALWFALAGVIDFLLLNKITALQFTGFTFYLATLPLFFLSASTYITTSPTRTKAWFVGFLSILIPLSGLAFGLWWGVIVWLIILVIHEFTITYSR